MAVMRKFVLVAIVAGCAETAPPPAQAPINGPAPHVFVQVTGFAANEGKAAPCIDVAQQSGFIVDPAAPVQAVLTLEGGRHRLQTGRPAAAIVRDEPLPGWDMGRLCRTALDGILP